MDHANRGKQFEAIIQNTLKSFGGHTIVKTDPGVAITATLGKGEFKARFKAGVQCDFEGGFMGYAVCLEAKDCSNDLFLKDRLKTHQWDRLYDTWQMGGISGVLLRFTGDTADQDICWLVEFGSMWFLFEKKSRIHPNELCLSNAHALLYGARGGRSVYFPALEPALLLVASRLSGGLRG